MRRALAIVLTPLLAGAVLTACQDAPTTPNELGVRASSAAGAAGGSGGSAAGDFDAIGPWHYTFKADQGDNHDSAKGRNVEWSADQGPGEPRLEGEVIAFKMDGPNTARFLVKLTDVENTDSFDPGMCASYKVVDGQPDEYRWGGSWATSSCSALDTSFGRNIFDEGYIRADGR